MSANEWEVNLWPHLFDCAAASPPSVPPLRVASVPLWAGGQSLLLLLFRGGVII